MMIGVGLDARLGLPFDQLRAAAREAARLGFESLGPELNRMRQRVIELASGQRPQPGRQPPRDGAPATEVQARLHSAEDRLAAGQHGWQQRAAIGSVFGRWAEIVGPARAAHTSPDSFADGELAVTADSTAWVTQVRLLAPQLIRRLAAELGDGTVRRVKVRGPEGRAAGGHRAGHH